MVTSGVAAYTLAINNMELLNIIIHIKSLRNITVISFHLYRISSHKRNVFLTHFILETPKGVLAKSGDPD